MNTTAEKRITLLDRIRTAVSVYELPTVSVILIIVSVLYYLPILLSGTLLGIQDWDVNFAWTEFTRQSILTYHQFPFWDPYRCGGAAHFANPQIGVLSVTTLFALVFGTVAGIKLSILFHGVLGALGCYMLSRSERLSLLASVFAAIIFAFSGITASFLSTGMVVFIGVAYMPWVLFFWKKSAETWPAILLSSLAFSVMVYADYHIPLLFAPIVILFTLSEILINWRARSGLRLLVFAISVLVLITPKLLVSIELMSYFPRTVQDISGYEAVDLPYFLLSRNQGLTDRYPADRYANHSDESSLYVGIIPILMAFLFFIRNASGIRHKFPYIVTLFACILLMLGTTVTPSSYTLIKELPFLSITRVAQRFRFDAILLFAIIAGAGMDVVLRTIRTRTLRRLLSFLILGITGIDLITFAPQFLKTSLIVLDTFPREHVPTIIQKSKAVYPITYSSEQPIPTDTSEITFTLWSSEFPAVRQHIGTIWCYDATTSRTSAISSDRPEYRGEWFMLHDSRSVFLRAWTPNVLSFQLTQPRHDTNEDLLVVNQNYYPGWTAEIDGKSEEVLNHSGLLAVQVSERTKTVIFRYQPYIGLIGRIIRMKI